jgi:hypothetical protein
MQPVCLLLPVQSDLASAIWTILELGFEARSPRLPNQRRLHPAPEARIPVHHGQRAAESPDHLLILARLIHDHLQGANPLRQGLWLDRRELIEFLRLLECGLARLERYDPAPDQQARLLEAAAGLLVHVRTRLGMARKPAQRQAAPRVRAATATG